MRSTVWLASALSLCCSLEEHTFRDEVGGSAALAAGGSGSLAATGGSTALATAGNGSLATAGNGSLATAGGTLAAAGNPATGGPAAGSPATGGPAAGSPATRGAGAAAGAASDPEPPPAATAGLGGQQPSGPACGDGALDPGELCDDGALNSDREPGACRTSCEPPRCGDSVTDGSEACDEGPANSDDTPNACRTSCVAPSCGDGVRDAGEACDQGADNNDSNPDACSTACRLASCGNGWLDEGEQCDAGEQNSDTSPDVCRTSCQQAGCGDGVVDNGEGCDEGSANSDGGSCTLACQKARCGDGLRQGQEACDLGAANQDGAYGGCQQSCTLGPRCGDGVVQPQQEQCDGTSDCNDSCSFVACASGQVRCDSRCVDPNWDDQKCGVNADCSGGASCGSGESCQWGQCEWAGEAVAINSFVTSDEVVGAGGGTITLSWSVSAAESVSISPGVGVVTGALVAVDVSETTTFTLTAQNPGGTATRSVTVEVSSQGVSQESAQLGSSSGEDFTDVAVDSGGNIYAVGSSDGSLPGASGTGPLFIAKYSAAASLQWVKRFGPGEFDSVSGVCVAADGSVMVSGQTNGEFQSGWQQGSSDAFIVNFSSSGEQRWAQQFGTSDSEQGGGVACDSSGRVVYIGTTYGDLVGSNQGWADVFLARLSSGGDVEWTAQLGTDQSDVAGSGAVDTSGNVYIVGSTDGAIEAGYSARSGRDAFIAKFNSGDAEPTWVRQEGTDGGDFPYDVAVDGSGNAVWVGQTEGAIGTESWDNFDAFVVKTSSGGQTLWKEQLGSDQFDGAGSVAIDGSGAILVAGSTTGALTSEPQLSARDAFLAKYSASRDLQWVRQFGSTDGDEGATGVVVTAAGSIVVGGYTYGSMAGANQGASDGFLAWFR